MTSAARDALSAIADGRGNFVIDLVQVREPNDGEVRVRLQAAGICHTDLKSLQWKGPLVMGHEGAGVIDAVGPGITAFSVGDAVLLNWAIPCGQCPQCYREIGSLCERTQGVSNALGSSGAGAGHTMWQGRAIDRSFHLGTLSEYSVVRAEAVIRLPENLTARLACILGCGVMTGVGSVVNVARVRPGESVVVVGCGGVGLSAIQAARLSEARHIIAIDRHAARLDLARSFGATHVLQLEDAVALQDVVASYVRELTEGRGADYAFEATGVTALAFLPLRLVRNGGTALQLSGAHGDGVVPMPWFFWNKTYVTPLYGACHPPRDFPRLFEWVSRGDVKLESLISHTYCIERLSDAFEDLRAGRTTKGVVVFD